MRLLKNGKEKEKGERKMGMVKSYIHDWLERVGEELGYNWDNVPDIGDMDAVASDSIQAWEYYGYKSEEDYYSNHPL